MTMPFVDSVHQYSNSAASGGQNVNQIKDAGAVRQVSAQAQQLVPGKVFEGTVTEIKNGQVTIGLNDGSTISARMDAGVSLEKGQPMLFEVKSNSGEQIAIRPVSLESAQNPTLLKALEAAGLKVNERNLSMVNQMMAEKMPINKESLLQMMRASSAFPKADMQTLVQMQKLGFVITEDSLNQFQNYKNGQQAILPEMNRLMEGIAELSGKIFGSETTAQTPGALLGFQQQILGILLGSGQQLPSEAQSANVQNQAALGQLAENQTVQNLTVTDVDAAQGAIIHQDLTESGGNFMNGNAMGEGFAGENLSQGGMAAGNSSEGAVSGNIGGDNAQMQGGMAAGEAAQSQGGTVGNVAGEAAQAQDTAAAQSGAGQGTSTVAQLLSSEQQGRLTEMIQEFSGARGNEQLLPEGKLNTSLSAGELLQQMMKVLEQSKNADSASLQKLFHSEEYKMLLKQAMTEQWTLTPDKLKEEGAVREFYQRLSSQMTELQQTLAQAGKDGSALAKSAQSVQSNLEFMNQVNQLYTYVQLPLKLQNQNAHSDLYVYTNKKNLRQKEGALTALLHLDMDHLGATDIFVKLLGTSVQTEFYFQDEVSCRLISQCSDELIKRLEEKGYSCEVKVENRRKKQDFVQDFLERENPPGKLQRYSFDVKA
jgi:hypothetical protein